MATDQENHAAIRLRVWRSARSCSVGFAFAVLAIAPGAIQAQQPPSTPVYVAGEAAVTGFSGVLPPPRIAAGADPNQTTFIDLNGPSLRVVDLRRMTGLPRAQLVGAPKPYTFTAAQIGQAFGVALDDAAPINIFAAATSAYGLPIVAPGPDGQPLHVRAGGPNASFMRGLWGPGGGPGSIWRIDGATGAVSLFATVTTNGRPNSGAALGGLAYDPDSKSLFVADRESGLIHRFGMDGRELDSYDHGVQGRAAQGLPPVPWNPQPAIDVASPQFDSAQPATWNYAPPERRVFGLAAREHRLYYAVADSLQIWSVGLNADGSFGKDAVIELAAPPSTGPTEISQIAFDEQGRMFLADRAAPTGAFDFEALAVPAIGRVLRYALIEITPDGRRVWQRQPDEYAIGFPPDYRNGNGGVAIGYNYYPGGELMLASCGGFMWTTGEDLRRAADPALAARLSQTGPLDVNGLQGNGTWRIRRRDKPPLESYFVDYTDAFYDPAERGHKGDIAIARPCSPAQRAALLPYGGAPPIGAPPVFAPPGPGHGPPGTPPNVPIPPPYTPPGGCPPGELPNAGANGCTSCPAPGIQVNGQCCTAGQLAVGDACSNSSCPAGQTPIGPSNFCCNSGQVYAGPNGAQACCGGALVNGVCPTPTPTPTPTPPLCPANYTPIGGACCLASQATSTGVCCPAGQAPGGPNNSQCVTAPPTHFWPPRGRLCLCAEGLVPSASGCCARDNLMSDGTCCWTAVTQNRAVCPSQTQIIIPCAAGYTKMPDGSCCNNRFVGADGKSCNAAAQPCPPGQVRDARGVCVAPPAPCPPGETRNPEGICVGLPGATPPAVPTSPCPPGKVRNPDGICVAAPPPACPPGEVRNARGVCVAAPPPACPRGQARNRFGVCAPLAKPSCARGFALNSRGVCAPLAPSRCPPGETRNRAGVCVEVQAPPAVGPIWIAPPLLFPSGPGKPVTGGPTGSPGRLRP